MGMRWASTRAVARFLGLHCHSILVKAMLLQTMRTRESENAMRAESTDARGGLGEYLF